MSAGEAAQANNVHIFLKGRVGDRLGSLTDTRVDYLHPRVAQRPDNNLCSAVVAVQSRLGDQYSYLFVFNHRITSASFIGSPRGSYQILDYIKLCSCSPYTSRRTLQISSRVALASTQSTMEGITLSPLVAVCFRPAREVDTAAASRRFR